jgi:hypothetical protein
VIFTPATDARGREIASTYTLPDRWALPDDGEGPTGPPIDLATAVPDDVAMELTLQLDGSGVVEQCTALKATPKSLGDPCAQYPVGKRWNTGAMRGGKPVRSQVVLRFSQTTTYKK